MQSYKHSRLSETRQQNCLTYILNLILHNPHQNLNIPTSTHPPHYSNLFKLPTKSTILSSNPRNSIPNTSLVLELSNWYTPPTGKSPPFTSLPGNTPPYSGKFFRITSQIALFEKWPAVTKNRFPCAPPLSSARTCASARSRTSTQR